jgi:FkbH-like protein
MTNSSSQSNGSSPKSEGSGAKGGSRPSLRFAISATFTAEPLQPTLEFWLEQLGFEGEVAFADYNQVFQQLLDPGSALGRNRGGVNAVLVRFEDWLRFSGSGLNYSMSAVQETEQVQRRADEFLEALETYSRRNSTPTILWFGPPSPTAQQRLGELFAELEGRATEACSRLPGIHVLNPSLVSRYGVKNGYDAKRDQLGHIPYTPLYYTALATALARTIHALKCPAIKLVALDCDNTLWNGVVGEDGPQGITFPEQKHLFLRALIEQQHQGVVLSLVSKNVEEDVFAVFDQRPDMELKREHLVGWRINWQPKRDNLGSLAQELNLGIDSFVFIDDNPVECAEIRAVWPQVLTIQLPPDADLAESLAHFWFFDRLNVTEEDRQRTRMYQQNAERSRLEQGANDIGSFIAGLDLHIDIGTPSAGQIPRVSQLTQRTNQFNFTTIRRGESDIEQLGRAGLECLRANVSDRFGDYGLVGVMIFGTRGEALAIDSFLVSCRVLGRGVEHAMLAHLGKIAQARGLKTIEAHFIPSKKNLPALNFIKSVTDKISQQDEAGTDYSIDVKLAADLAYRPGQDAKDQLEFARTGGGKTAKAPATAAQPSGFERSAVMQRIITEWRDINAVAAAVAARGKSTRPSLETPYLEPRTSVEREITAIWQRILGVEPIGVTDDYTALGGTSLLAVQLFAEIEERFGMRLPLTAILDAPTVEKIAIRLSQREVASGTAARSLRAAKAHRRNLFLVHDGDGETLLYMNLARALPETLSVWGLDPLADDTIPIKHTRIPDMAAHYIEHITRIQPAGPYLLGGMCAGGVIAFEIALQLEAQGHTVALVALLDSADPQAARKFALQNTRRARRFFSALTGAPEPEGSATSEANEAGEAAPAAADSGESRHSLKVAAEKVRNAAEYEISSRTKRVADRSRFLLFRQALDRQLEIPAWLQGISVRTVYELAEQGYRPSRKLRGRAALFRATSGQGDDEPFINLYRDARLGWDQRVEHSLAVYDVPGGHASMLQGPNATALAQKMQACIDIEYTKYSEYSSRPATDALDKPVRPEISANRLVVVIVNYRSAALTIDCLKSLAPELAEIAGSRVVVVENASGEAEPLARAIAENGWQSWVNLKVSERNGGYAYANNLAIEPALQESPPPQYIHLLNPDTRIYRGAVHALLEFMDDHPQVGIAGSSFENGDGTDWPIAFRFPSIWSELDRGLQLGVASKLLQPRIVAQRMGKEEAPIDWVPGASMMVRSQVFRDTGLMDNGYFLYFEETDFCLRARRAGWPCWYVPKSRVVHLAGQSTGVTKRNERPPRTPDYCFESRNRYFIKNHGLAYAVGADLTFGVSFALWRLRRAIQGKPDNDPPNALADFVRHSVIFERNRLNVGHK